MFRCRSARGWQTADVYAEAGFTAVVQDMVLGEGLTAYVGLVRTRPLWVVVLAPHAGRASVGRAPAPVGPAVVRPGPRPGIAAVSEGAAECDCGLFGPTAFRAPPTRHIPALGWDGDVVGFMSVRR